MSNPPSPRSLSPSPPVTASSLSSHSVSSGTNGQHKPSGSMFAPPPPRMASLAKVNYRSLSVGSNHKGGEPAKLTLSQRLMNQERQRSPNPRASNGLGTTKKIVEEIDVTSTRRSRKPRTRFDDFRDSHRESVVSKASGNMHSGYKVWALCLRCEEQRNESSHFPFFYYSCCFFGSVIRVGSSRLLESGGSVWTAHRRPESIFVSSASGLAIGQVSCIEPPHSSHPCLFSSPLLFCYFLQRSTNLATGLKKSKSPKTTVWMEITPKLTENFHTWTR